MPVGVTRRVTPPRLSRAVFVADQGLPRNLDICQPPKWAVGLSGKPVRSFVRLILPVGQV